MYLTVPVIAIENEGVTDVAGVTTVVDSPVAHVIDGTTVVDLVVHHVVPYAVVVLVAGLLNILDVGVEVKESDHTADHIPQQSVTALARIDGVESNTYLINQLRNGLSVISGLAITIPHLRVVVRIVIELGISGHLIAIEHVVVTELAKAT